MSNLSTNQNIPQIWREANDLIIMHIPTMETADGFNDVGLSEEGAEKLFFDLAKVLKQKYSVEPLVPLGQPLLSYPPRRELKSEEVFYYVLVSSEGGEEVFQEFCQIWSGFNKGKTVEALQFFCSNKLAIEPPLNLSPDKIEPFLKSKIFMKRVLPWFEAITRDGERAARTLQILLEAFVSYHVDPDTSPTSMEEALNEASKAAAQAVADAYFVQTGERKDAGELMRRAIGIV